MLGQGEARQEGTSTSSVPNRRACAEYTANVGATVITLRPIPETMVMAWMSVFEPLATTTASAGKPWRSAKRASSVRGPRSG